MLLELPKQVWCYLHTLHYIKPHLFRPHTSTPLHIHTYIRRYSPYEIGCSRQFPQGSTGNTNTRAILVTYSISKLPNNEPETRSANSIHRLYFWRRQPWCVLRTTSRHFLISARKFLVSNPGLKAVSQKLQQPGKYNNLKAFSPLSWFINPTASAQLFPTFQPHLGTLYFTPIIPHSFPRNSNTCVIVC